MLTATPTSRLPPRVPFRPWESVPPTGSIHSGRKNALNRRRLLSRLSSGAVRNVRFADLTDLVQSLGFRLDRVSGSHHIFIHPEIPELVNLQQVDGEAKPYQVRQLVRLVERYNLKLEAEP